MQATIKDVARLANVSPSTVSRVISNNPAISAQTADRVRKAMAELHYRPNQIARSLTNRSTQTLGLLLPSAKDYPLINPFFVQAMRGITTYAKQYGYYLLLAIKEQSATEEDHLGVLKDLVGSGRVDGMILTTVRKDDPQVAYLKSIDFPFVVIGHPYEDSHCLWVDNDSTRTMYQLTEKLIGKGCTSFAYLGDAEGYRVTRDRLNGFMTALADNDIPFDHKLLIERHFEEGTAYVEAKELFSYKIPDAVIATDDMIASEVQKVLVEIGMQDKVRVAGYNNTAIAVYATPPLTSVDVNAERLGTQAARLLIASLKGEPNESNYRIVPATIIERASTGQ